MAEGERLLSEEEMNAIGEVAARGGFGDGYNLNVETLPFDLLSDAKGDGLDTSFLKPINDRFIRHFRIAMRKELNYQIEITEGSIEAYSYDDMVEKLSNPASVNVTRITPLKGESFVVLDPGVISSCVDAWFGGGAKFAPSESPERQFSETEKLVAKKIRIAIFAAIKEAWSASFDVQCELIQSESDIRLIDIADPSAILLGCGFEVGEKDDPVGEVRIAYPMEGIKLLKGAIEAVPEINIKQNRLERIWSDKLKKALHEVPFRAVIQAGKVPLSLGSLRALKVGDTIPLKDLQQSVLKINGLDLFNVEIGSLGNNTAVKILNSRNDERSL